MMVATTLGFSSAHDDLTRLIRRVRDQWRLARALRGAAIVLGAGLLVLLVTSYGLERFKFNDTAVAVLRVLAYLSLLALTARYLVLPLLPRVSDDRVALYIEEHDPSLDAALVSAVEVGAVVGVPRPDRSPVLSRELMRLVLARVRAAELGSRTERGDLIRSTAALVLAAVVTTALFVFGPQMLRNGMRTLFPWGTAEAAPVYAITVTPGDVTVARGGDQQIEARLRGFGAERVEILIKRTDSSSTDRRGTAGAQDSAQEWERVPMSTSADSGAYVFRLFDISSRTEYFVESNGVRSALYRIEVADLPYVHRIDLEYRFPAYTGLPPQIVEDAGDITALEGTTVVVRARPTMPVRAGQIAVEGQVAIPLTADSAGVLSGSLRIARPGFYHLELQAADGETRRASLDYTIDVIADQPPTVSITKPGRDSKVTSVEEVFTEAEAEDDYGIAKLDLVYSVNGGERRTASLYGGKGRRAKRMSAGHTFLLEELSLQPGDVISYFARATDANNKSATTDIYFLQVRPYGQEYRQAEQQGGGGGGGMEGNEALSARQREIIAATFKTVRDRTVTPSKEYQENLATIALAQGRLREQVGTLARRMVERGVAADSSLGQIAELLPKAAEEMRAAEELLGKRKPNDALPPEERALRYLQQAEAAFREVQVSTGGDPGGGGGGQQNAEELADLFELEVDKLRNQYETVQRGQQQAADEQVDEVLEKLKRLAARQQQENERMRERANNLGAQSGGGGAGQRQLAEETEEAARRLERLAREQSSSELRESARRLRDAAEAMRRTAGDAGQRAQAGGSSALDRLQEARRLLDNQRTGRLERDIQNARRNAEDLAQRQREIARDVESIKNGRGASGDEERIFERKDSLASGVQQLEAQLERMSRESRREQKDAARKLQEAAGAIRDRQIPDRIRYSKGVVREGSPEYARTFEEQIGSAIEGVRDKIAEAAGAIGEPEGRNAERALERARGLVRGLESLEERMRESRESGGERADAERQGEGEGEGQGRGQQQGQGQTQGQGQGRGEGQTRGQQGQQPGGGQGITPGGGGMNTGPGRLSPEEIRQYTREFRERRLDAESLRNELRQDGRDIRDLDAIIGRMRALESQRVYGDQEEIDGIQAAVIEGLKAYEFALRRALEGSGNPRLHLGGSAEVPPDFRKLVEEYYKSLAGRAPK